MTTLQRFFVLSALPVALWNANCVDTSGFQLQHPLVAGGVQQNSEQSQEYQRERINGIQPGSLTSEASLVAMTEQETCFQVVLRTTGDRADLAEPRSWGVFLRGEPKFEDMGPVFKDSAPQTQVQVNGVVVDHITEQERICDAYGANCYTRNITRSVQRPTTVNLITGGGTVCFNNHGNLGRQTSHLTLHLDDPRTEGPAQRRVVKNRNLREAGPPADSQTCWPVRMSSFVINVTPSAVTTLSGIGGACR